MVTEALTKGDKSPVTVADFAAQAVVARLLKSTYPDVPLVGEESAAALQTPEEAETLDQITAFVSTQIRNANKQKVTGWINYGSTKPTKDYWTLDPIDGTKGFLRAQQYAVAFGLVVNGQVELGVLGCPNLTDGSLKEIGGPGSLILAQRARGPGPRRSPAHWISSSCMFPILPRLQKRGSCAPMKPGTPTSAN